MLQRGPPFKSNSSDIRENNAFLIVFFSRNETQKLAFPIYPITIAIPVKIMAV